MLKALLGDPNARKIKKFQPLVTEINLLEEDIKNLSDEELRSKTSEFKERLDKARNYEQREDILEEILPEAFAIVREAGIRVLGMRHFDVQLLGGNGTAQRTNRRDENRGRKNPSCHTPRLFEWIDWKRGSRRHRQRLSRPS